MNQHISVPCTNLILIKGAELSDDNVWLRANLKALNDAMEVLFAEPLHGEAWHEAQLRIGSAYHFSADMIVMQGYPDPRPKV